MNTASSSFHPVFSGTLHCTDHQHNNHDHHLFNRPSTSSIPTYHSIMLVPTLLSAGFALTANAFLLPLNVANKYEAAKNHITPTLLNPQFRDIILDCSDCPYALASKRNGLHEWTNSVKSDLEMTFTAEENKLKLNGVPFYPVTPPFTPAPLTAHQIKKPEDKEAVSKEGYDGDLSLSYSIEVHDMKGSSGPEQGATATEITFSILGLDNEVAHVDDIKIKTLSLPNPANGLNEVNLFTIFT